MDGSPFQLDYLLAWYFILPGWSHSGNQVKLPGCVTRCR